MTGIPQPPPVALPQGPQEPVSLLRPLPSSIDPETASNSFQCRVPPPPKSSDDVDPSSSQGPTATAAKPSSNSLTSSPVHSPLSQAADDERTLWRPINAKSNSVGPAAHGLNARDYSVDLEKRQLPRPTRGPRPESSSTILDDTYCTDPDEEDVAGVLQSRAGRILIYLMFFAGFVSLFISLWTLSSLLLVLLLQPFRLCKPQSSFRQQLIRWLGPALELQLLLIFSPKPARPYSAALLVLIHLLSPLICVGVSLAAWTAAAFWFYAAILGDPNGSDKPHGYNDGRASVLGVRAWWANWLMRSAQ